MGGVVGKRTLGGGDEYLLVQGLTQLTPWQSKTLGLT